MRLGNIGHKDKYGKQRRIEHRGKYLRISRTGATVSTGNRMGAMIAMLGSRPMLNVFERVVMFHRSLLLHQQYR